jgi:predicted lipoprotein
MQLMNAPPKKFSQADTKLKEIHKIYLDTESLTQARPASLAEFNSSIDTLDKKMSQTSQDLKSNLPGSLKQELEKAKLKYRGLNDF